MPSKARVTLTIGHDPITGEAIRKVFCGRTKKEARKLRDQYKIEAATGRPQEYTINTFESWAWEWLNIYVDGTVEHTTYRGYELCINHLIEDFGPRPLNTITPVMVQAFFKKKRTLSQSMVDKLRITLNAIMETAVDNDKAIKNPMRNLGPFKGREKEQRHVYNAQQAEIVADFAKSHPFGLGVYLILKTGLRRGELMGLIPSEDFDFANNRIYVQRTVQESGGKVNVKDRLKNEEKLRVVPVEPAAMSVLNRDIRCHQAGFLFKSRRGGVMAPGSWSKNRYAPFLVDLDKFVAVQKLDNPTFPTIPHLTPHELRHTYGTLLFKAGNDPYTVQRIMGHKNQEVTMDIYVHDGIEDVESRVVWPEKVLDRAK
ncbi:MAG: tyrosine-type recombinase/integrase [Christensenella sp.]|uniref:site-specific integrase n=1 Tax=Christensenella sp. TaxID=1935934 RepID=UPI002B20A30B|nr:tyrosine-type recombinase/integrase [Christensenella sp.]MEA5004132.1 tyrosine-type recombinase/integrase [Christensenella sp.]